MHEDRRHGDGTDGLVAMAGQAEALARLHALDAPVTVVLGPAGSGKTALAAAAARRLAGDDVRVRRVSAALAGRSDVATLVGLAFEDDAPTGQGAVLHVDDAHELSAPDLAMLDTLVRRLGDAGRVRALVLTGQGRLAHRLSSSGAAAMVAAGRAAVRLDPATARELVRLVVLRARRAGVAVDPGAAERLAHAAAGSPGRAVRLVSQALGAARVAGCDRLDEAVAARVLPGRSEAAPRPARAVRPVAPLSVASPPIAAPPIAPPPASSRPVPSHSVLSPADPPATGHDPAVALRPAHTAPPPRCRPEEGYLAAGIAFSTFVSAAIAGGLMVAHDPAGSERGVRAAASGVALPAEAGALGILPRMPAQGVAPLPLPLPSGARQAGVGAPSPVVSRAVPLPAPRPAASTVSTPPRTVSAVTIDVPVRVVIHYPDGVRPQAERLALDLGAVLTHGGIELQGVQARVSRANLRYFHPGDRPLAERVGALLRSEAPEAMGTVTVRDFTHFRPSPRRGTVEVWLSG